MTTDDQKRQYVANLYPGRGWKTRVERMPIDQVVAIFLGHQTEGTKPYHQESNRLDIPPQNPHQNEDDFPIY